MRTRQAAATMSSTTPHPIFRMEPLLLAALIVFPGCGQVFKYTGAAGTIAYAIGTLVACVLVFRNLAALSPRTRMWLPAMVALGLFSTAAIIILYPIAQSGVLGPGADRDEALNQALDALASGRYPYYEVTYFGNVLTPMPGALLLASPAWLLGNAAWQNILWLALLLLFFWRSLSPSISVLLAASTVVFHPGVMQDVVTGGDFFDNAIYVLLATSAVIVTARGPKGRHMVALAFLGIAICSRPIYLVAPVALTALFWRHLGIRPALRTLAIPGAVALALVLPFYLYDPAGFTPIHVAAKADLPIPHAAAVLGILSLTVAALAARLPFDAYALYGWIGVALSVAFVPVMIKAAAVGEYFYLANVAVPVTLFGGLWVAKQIERHLRLPGPAFSSGTGSKTSP